MKFSVKKITLAVLAFVLIAVMITANIILSVNASIIHRVFAGTEESESEQNDQIENVLGVSDQVVQEIAEDSIVMLKNENNVLPLKDIKKVNLFGWNATDNGFILNGGGSGGVQIHDDNKVTLSQAFKKENIEVNENLLQKYAAYDNYDADFNDEAECVLVNPGAEFYTSELMEEAKAFSDTAVVVLGRFAREHYDGGQLEIPLTQPKRNLPADNSRTFLEISTEEEALLDIVCNNFGNVIVLLNTGNPMETGFLNDSRIDAAFYIGFPGQSGALAIPRILKGTVTPSGRLADTYAYDHQTNNPTWANAIYPTEGSKNIHYAEGIYFGYKWYETADAEGYFDSVNNSYGSGYDGVVQYPFGYGQSYARFKWEVLEYPDVSSPVYEDSEFNVKVRVTNIDETYAGKEVVQLYVTPPYTKGGIEKAHVKLISFAKTETLDPGEFQDVTLTFTAYDLASYDDYNKNNNEFTGYEVELGEYKIKLMSDAHTPKDCENNEIILNVKEEIWMILDPDTGEIVENRFTGDSAYAGIPIDGTTANDKVKYMSRENFAGTYPQNMTPDTYNNTIVNSGANHVYDGFGEVPMPTQGVESNLRLVTKADGSFASEKELSGEVQAELKYNDELLTKLSDYNAPEWETLLNQLSHNDIKNLTGRGGFQTYQIQSVGKPRNVDRDGPSGFQNGAWDTTKIKGYTAFPCEALMGCSWSAKTAYNMGRAQGVVAANMGIKGWYGPGVNLHRSVFNSRNFEYYSEDGVLSGILAGEVVRGAKNNGLYCYIKHFVASESGRNPWDKNTWLTEQSLRECYLKPFELAVKRGGANGVMTAFSRLGAVFTGANRALCTDILRYEWGFEGTVITDWYQGYMGKERCIRAGNDLFLDGTGGSPASYDEKNPVMAYTARQSAKNILYTYVDTYVTAREFQLNGDPDDPYKVNVGTINVTPEPFSVLFVALWVTMDVILVAGAGVCVFFILKKPKNEIAE